MNSLCFAVLLLLSVVGAFSPASVRSAAASSKRGSLDSTAASLYSRYLSHARVSLAPLQANGEFRNWIKESIWGKPTTSAEETLKQEYFNRPGPWDEKDLDSLMGANKAWIERMTNERPDFFEEIRKGHAPKILWIGCSDARVPANEIIGQPPGAIFVHRNIANQVVNTDFNCMSVIQYAVDILQVKHIMVCGHYDCGGVKAALENTDHRSPLENWLRHIRDTYRLHKEELNNIEDETARYRRLVELNVIEQCLNIFKTAVVQRKRVETYGKMRKAGPQTSLFVEPRIHAYVYDPKTGELTKLSVDFKEYIDDLGSVYDLYTVENPRSAGDYPGWSSSPRVGGQYGKKPIK
jgi:carbonic anhydrase